MAEGSRAKVAVIDYGMGNLFSVRHACAHVGLRAVITESRQEVLSADAIILPGVGAFADAMEALRRLDLVGPLREVAASARPLLGICLGMQLLLTESWEFGRHAGLNIIPGSVVRFEGPRAGAAILKVPQVCWNRLYRPAHRPTAWEESLLAGLPDGTFMYFVHSYYCRPEDPLAVVANTRYGSVEFCSCLARKNVFACQCHPERSGSDGLRVYTNLASLLEVSRP